MPSSDDTKVVGMLKLDTTIIAREPDGSEHVIDEFSLPIAPITQAEEPLALAFVAACNSRSDKHRSSKSFGGFNFRDIDWGSKTPN